jgi:hypothetical protein
MMSLRPSMVGGEQRALDLEAIIRSAEVMRRPLQLPDIRLEDYRHVAARDRHPGKGRRSIQPPPDLEPYRPLVRYLAHFDLTGASAEVNRPPHGALPPGLMEPFSSRCNVSI